MVPFPSRVLHILGDPDHVMQPSERVGLALHRVRVELVTAPNWPTLLARDGAAKRSGVVSSSCARGHPSELDKTSATSRSRELQAVATRSAFGLVLAGDDYPERTPNIAPKRAKLSIKKCATIVIVRSR